MATYNNLTDTARMAVNRMVAVTEKEKSLLHKALDAQSGDIANDYIKQDGTTILTSDWTTGSNNITTTGLYIFPPATGIIAYAGGGQANATVLTEQFNRVDYIAATGDSVKLPVPVAGTVITVLNTGDNQLDLYPHSGGSIEPTGVSNIAIQLSVNTAITVYAWTTTRWGQV